MSGRAATIDLGNARTLPELDELLRAAQGAPDRIEMDPTQRLVLSRARAAPGPVDADLPTSGIALGPLLGRGGMGEVYLAQQRSLGRDVAVKRLRDDVQSDEARRALLQEAWISGALEHPNIAPVYDLQFRQDEPLVVMKCIEGVSWAECLVDATRLPGDQRRQDPLTHHLEILLQLCNAVHYAHSKRIIHRDLKPANVMIGAFGEIVLLDWGLALSIDEAGGDSRFPRASAETEIAGTPAYMAPEMVTGDPSHIDERTDVYLLGAILHEIVTGRSRHEGTELREVLHKAYASAPFEYGADVPAELGAICNRATAADPSKRFPSAEAFRSALVEFLGHRNSIAVAADAAAQLEELRVRLRHGADAAPAGVALHDLFGACRFGFQHALRLWPHNSEARAGLAEALELMVEFELKRENVAAAAALLAEMPEGRAQLSDAVASLQNKIEAKQREIETLRRREREQDLTTGSRHRSIGCAVIGVTVSAYLMVLYVLEQQGHFAWTLGALASHSLGTLVLFGSVLFKFRQPLFQNQANRRVAYVVILAVVAGLWFRGVALLGGVAIPATLALEYVVWGLGCAVLALISHRMLLGAAAMLAAGALGAIWPSHVLLVLGASTLAAMLWIAYVWWPRPASGAS